MLCSMISQLMNRNHFKWFFLIVRNGFIFFKNFILFSEFSLDCETTHHKHTSIRSEVGRAKGCTQQIAIRRRSQSMITFFFFQYISFNFIQIKSQKEQNCLLRIKLYFINKIALEMQTLKYLNEKYNLRNSNSS